jgi:hypothetical protein
VQREAARLRLLAVDVAEQSRQVGSHSVDDVQLQRFVGREVRRPAHREVGPAGVAAVRVSERAE